MPKMSNVRKIIAFVIVLCLIFGCISASASRKGTIYESADGNYVATKISHPESGAGEIDGLIDYESGDPDRGQSYSWAAIGYKDSIYVGTCYGAIYSTIKIMAAQNGFSIDDFKAVANAGFNGKLYLGDPKNNPEDVNRAVIVKFNTKTGDMKIVDGPSNVGGFRAAIEFNDKLYFSCGARIPYILEIDPNDNDKTQKVFETAERKDPSIASGIRGLTVVGDKLITSGIDDNGAYIAASENPSLGKDSFKIIATQQDLFDYPAYHHNDSIFGGAIWDMVEFNEKLYFTVVAGTVQNPRPFALFSGEEKPDGSWDFELIVGDLEDGAQYPFGFGAARSGAANLVVHDNHLYIGGYNDPMIALPQVLALNFEPIYKDLNSPVCLWRMDEDNKAELIAGEPNELFPDVKGNMNEGFGSNLNQYVWRMASFDNKLYVGTFDISGLASPLQQFTNGDLLKRSPAEWKTQIEYIKDLIEVINKQPKTFSLNDDKTVLKDIQYLASTMDDMAKLFSKGGANDLKSTERFHTLLLQCVNIYEKVRDYLPDTITEKLDSVLTKENADNIFYFIGTCKYLSQGEAGFDLLVSSDGYNFDVITRDGFGDEYNHGLRVFAISNQGLFLGTANPFYGTQVWHIEEKNKTNNIDDETIIPSEIDTDTSSKVTESQTQIDAASKDESPNTGASAAVAVAASALTAGVVLALVSKKKKEL